MLAFWILIILSLLPGTPPPDPGTMSGTDENGLSWQASPGLVPVTIAANSGAIFGEESLLRQKFAFFMQAENNSSNVTFYMLPNLTMEKG